MQRDDVLIAPARAARGSRVRRRPSRLALGLVAALVVAGSAELALRVRRYGPTSRALGEWTSAPPWERLRTIDAAGDPRPRPGGEAAWALGPGEPVIRYRLNGLGLRADRETAAPPPGVCRVLAIGDAYTFGYGVARREAWPARLARRSGMDVLNAGFPDMNVEQQRRRLDALLAVVRPQVVVATFDWWNVPLDGPREPVGQRRWSRAWWVENVETRLARLASRMALADEGLRVARRALVGRLVSPSGLARELEPLTLSPSALSGRWARTRAALAGMAGDARAAGARFVLVVTPLDVQVDRRRNALYTTGALPYPSHGFVDVDYGAARAMPDALRAFAADAGIPLLDLGRDFERHGGARLFFAHDYHAAPAGHGLIARRVAEWLARNRACAAPL